MASAAQWERLRQQLEALVESVTAEIRAYPPPITACDAQFNRLLELRRLVPLELQRLEAAAGDPTMSVEAFLLSSPCAGEIPASALESMGIRP